MHRRRRGCRGRLPIQPKIGTDPKAKKMMPEPIGQTDPVYIDMAELESLRLVDLEGLYQEDAGQIMGVSRGTIWRLLVSARRKIVRAIFEGRPLIIGNPNEE